MSKFDEAMELYQAQNNELNLGIDTLLLRAVTKGLGPSIYNIDASKVSSADPEELARVKNNFLIKKLGMSDSPELDAAIHEVVEKLGTSNRNKYRAVFYTLLVIKFGKQGVYGK
ncbi:MAG: DUF2853 family protein [Pseudarcicella sp.]|nr:DUF2853 family protein [Pseudarcicella sp.]